MSFLRRDSNSYTLSSVFPTYLIPSVPFRRKSRQSSTDSTSSAESTASAISAASSSTSTSTSTSNPFMRCPSPSPIPDSPNPSAVLPPDDKLLRGHGSHIQCARCSTDLCLTSQIISKGFTGRHGRAYLVQGTTDHLRPDKNVLPNTYLNRSIPRNLVTGLHIVSDVSCAICGSNLGWKYVQACEESQKYKVGKFILETKKIRLNVSWEHDSDDDDGNKKSNENDSQAAIDRRAKQIYNEVLPLHPRELQRPSADHVLSRLSNLVKGKNDHLEFDSQDEDECEDLFAGVWTPDLAAARRQKKERLATATRKPAVASASASTNLNLGATSTGSLDTLS
ncbi:hypothetical protein ABEF93_001275 [Exophiala dermatitidis]